MLYLIFEIFLGLFFGIPFTFTAIVLVVEQVNGWVFGSLFALIISLCSFFGIYKLEKKRKTTRSQRFQEQQIISDIQAQACANEAQRTIESLQAERDHLKTQVQTLREELQQSGSQQPVDSSLSPRIQADPILDEDFSLSGGLSYLDVKALKFWNKKRTDFIVPSYYSESAFGRNVEPALRRFLSCGYLSLGDMRQRIALKTVNELKAILSEHELKTSGNKPELIQRILDNFDNDQLDALFPVNIYKITEEGQKAMNPYSILEDNDAHSLGLSYYRLIQAKKNYPADDNNTILTRLLSEDVQSCYEKQDQSRYQQVITTSGRFMEEIGHPDLAVECYALSFFVWTFTDKLLTGSNLDQQNYYMAKNLERAGQMCGYDWDKLLSVIQETISKNNPFALGTPQNIDYAIQSFISALGMH